MRYWAVLGLMILWGAGGLSAQDQEPEYPQAPDNEAILKAILDIDSPLYYPVLMTRYRAGDTTLTLNDYRHLYYGYAWQPEYKPFETPSADFKLLEEFDHGLDSLTTEDCERIIKFANEVMKTEPFHPSTVNFLAFAYGALGDTLNERINYHRLNMLLETIRSSGTGIRENSPWHILYYSDATDVLASMNLLYGKNTVVSRTTEYFPLHQRNGKIRGYYFNFERIYWYRPDKLPEKKPTGWGINGIPLKKRR